MTVPADVALTRLGIAASAPATTRIDFIDWDLGTTTELKDMNGTRGKYTKDSARVRPNLTRVNPRLRTQPTSLELASLLPWILSGTPSGSGTVTYPLGNTPLTQVVQFDPNVGNMYTLAGVAVQECRIRATQGEPLELDMTLIGQTSTISGSFPPISLDVSTDPFLFTDCVLVVNGTTVQSKEFELVINNGIDPNRFFNSPTLTLTNRLTRQLTTSVLIPHGVYSALFGVGESTSVVVTATFTNGNAVLTFTLEGVRFTPKNPQTPFQGEVMLPLDGELFSPDGTTEALVTTLAVGP